MAFVAVYMLRFAFLVQLEMLAKLRVSRIVPDARMLSYSTSSCVLLALLGNGYYFPCLTSMFLPICAPCCQMENRKKLNRLYNISDPCGTGCSGCLYANFCGCCKVIQELRFLKDVELNGWVPNNYAVPPTQQHLAPAPSIYRT